MVVEAGLLETLTHQNGSQRKMLEIQFKKLEGSDLTISDIRLAAVAFMQNWLLKMVLYQRLVGCQSSLSTPTSLALSGSLQDDVVRNSRAAVNLAAGEKSLIA